MVSSLSSSLRSSLLASVPPEPIAQSPWSSRALPTSPLFGTDGIRGRVGDLLTAPLALQVGYWTGLVLQNTAGALGPVIVGQDSRHSGDMLASALAAGLTAAGLEVWNLGLCPTPGVAYLTSCTAAIGGVMISASHNPPEDNGIKIFGQGGRKLGKNLQGEIEQGIRGHRGLGPLQSHGQNHGQHPGQPLQQPCGRHVSRPEMVERYALSLRNSLPLDSLEGLKVVLDLAHGAAAQLGPMVFRALGAELVCLHDEPCGDRINVNCGSTHLQRLQAAVLEQGADLGFAFDGDADRVLAVDHRGKVVDGDGILFLWGKHLRQQGQLPDDTIVTTVMSNLGFERAWQALGGKFIRTAVGDQYVQAEMAASGAMLGGEQSGHILCSHYGLTGDGLLTALHISALVHGAQVSLAEQLASSFTPYPQLLCNVRVEDREKRRRWEDCEPLMALIDQAQREMGDRGRILVRPSGTEPLIRVMVEAAEAELVEGWTARLADAVREHLVG
ncbi:MAG: phosphoglucosamine mutase [Synechococcales cyanobacterium RM1_1_8]|nr:phosphoglucosamine mutase [Synechococcales cyanobacterium RM1_1_8]